MPKTPILISGQNQLWIPCSFTKWKSLFTLLSKSNQIHKNLFQSSRGSYDKYDMTVISSVNKILIGSEQVIFQVN